MCFENVCGESLYSLLLFCRAFKYFGFLVLGYFVYFYNLPRIIDNS